MSGQGKYQGNKMWIMITGTLYWETRYDKYNWHRNRNNVVDSHTIKNKKKY